MKQSNVATAAEAVARSMNAIRTPMQHDSINTRAWAEWFDHFELRGDDKTRRQLESLVDAAATFVMGVRIGKPARWLSLLGASGGGKTKVAKRIWNWWRRSPMFRADVHGEQITYPGQWCYWPSVAADLQSNRGYGQLADLATEKLVVFDEIGSERDVTAHVRDNLARVLCSRVGKWTVITSNKTLHQIASDIDARVASRMVRDGSVVIELDVPDYSLSV